MSDALGVRRNSALSLGSAVARLTATMVLFVGIARTYGAEAFGQFTFAHTYLTLFYLLADFGFDVFLVAELPRRRGREREVFTSVLLMKLALAAAATVLMAALALTSGVSTTARWVLLLLGLSVIPNAAQSVCFALLRSHEQFQHELAATILQNAGLLLALAVLALLGAPIVAVAAAFAASKYLGLAFIAPRVLRLLPAARLREAKGTLMREVWLTGLPYGVHLVFGTLYFQLDTLLLGYMQGEEPVGQYQAAMKLLVFLLVIPDVAVQGLLPLLARLFVGDPARWKRIALLAAKSLAFLGLPPALAFIVCGEDIIRLVYGAGGFDPAAGLMPLLGIVLASRFAAEIFALMLTTSGHQTARMVIVLILTAVNLLGNLVLIPRAGILGAASVSVVTNLLAGGLYVAALHVTRVGLPAGIGWRPLVVLAACAALGSTLWILDLRTVATALPLLLLVPAAVAYAAGFTPEERTLVRAFAVHRGARP
jgi:O-antigen/teichoic acid export membrane protein